MRVTMLMACSVVLLLISLAMAAPKRAEPKECPTELALEAVETAIQNAASCQTSMDTFEACSRVASGDVLLGEAVVRKCEDDFLHKLDSGRKQAYQRELDRCWRKYRARPETMYRSFEAMCAAGVAQNYSRRFLKAGGRPTLK
jgi:hypothetical protein